MGRTDPAPRVKWESAARAIERGVRDGSFGEAGYLPAERELAASLGVSRPTLRKAIQSLTASGLLASLPGVGTRVNEEAHASAAPRIVALALPDIGNRFFVEVTEAVEYTLLQRGCQLLLSNYRHQPVLEEQQLRQFLPHSVRGVILGHESAWPLPAALAEFEARSIPVVLLFGVPAETRFDTVVIDERAGVEQAMRYLFSLGHRRIAYCRPLPGFGPHVRELAFLDLMLEAGLDTPAEFVLPFEAVERSADPIRRLFSRRRPPTAIFAGNDRAALIVMKRLAECGLEIPGDVSVMGFDNLAHTEHLPVPLTTVDQPKEVMGRRAAELLLERLDFGAGMPARREVYQPRLVIRASCAAR